MINLRDQRIAVLMGGPGNERPVSLKSGEGVTEALRSLGAEVIPVDVQGNDLEVPKDVLIAFNVIHGTFGEDGQLQRLLEGRGIRYTGEGVRGSELAIDKIATKRRLIDREVSTGAFEVIRVADQPSMKPPFVVKAPREGSSVGVYIVKSEGEVAKTLEEAGRYSSELLVEEYIQGRELTVGVVGGEVLPAIEIRPKRPDEFYDFSNKYNFLAPEAAGADHLCPAPLDEATADRVRATALAAHRALDLEVYSRVDLLLDGSGRLAVLEINTIPGMTPVSLLPEAARAAGIGYPELCARIIELSLARGGGAE